ncbi:ACP synthase [Candidatus Woesearchaeota archaeon CG10_big_fil_rev_8_21_14_0_10_37_12]|nr:MAG: ACP synthase [Candidatus Woesearchaeota archaeon CG10_big_fil_rev_8_21_14_0_10_37_12]
MKTLSLKQPWAELVVSGRKTIEVRKWNTKFRGEFLVHASLNTNKEKEKEFSFKDLPTGCIVGKATLIDVKKYTSKEEFEKDSDKHFAKGWHAPKAHGFILENAQRLPLKTLKGKLNFFEVE